MFYSLLEKENEEDTIDRGAKSCKGVIGLHGIGKVNNNWENLLQFRSTCGLYITNTNFKLKNIQKYTWIQPRFRIPHIITKQRMKRECLITWVMCGADGDTDHALVPPCAFASVFEEIAISAM